MANDEICFDSDLVSGNSTSATLNKCFVTDFYATYQLKDNWNDDFDLKNVGGILGMGRNATDLKYDSFWVNATNV